MSACATRSTHGNGTARAGIGWRLCRAGGTWVGIAWHGAPLAHTRSGDGAGGRGSIATWRVIWSPAHAADGRARAALLPLAPDESKALEVAAVRPDGFAN